MNESASAGSEQSYLVSDDQTRSHRRPADSGKDRTDEQDADNTRDGDLIREPPVSLDGYENL